MTDLYNLIISGIIIFIAGTIGTAINKQIGSIVGAGLGILISLIIYL
jgi:hypothetical protein